MNADRDPEAAAWERARQLRVEREDAERQARAEHELAARDAAMEAERAERVDQRRSLVRWGLVVLVAAAFVAVVIVVAATLASNDDDVATDVPASNAPIDERLAPGGAPSETAPIGRRVSPSLDADTPPIIDLRGDNFETVWRQAQVLEGWLLRHPNPSMVSQIYVPGTPTYDEVHAYIDDLSRNGRAVVVERYRIADVALVDRRSADEVELRYTDSYEFRELIDAGSGEVVDHQASDGQPRAWSLVLQRGSDGRWRVASITPAPA